MVSVDPRSVEHHSNLIGIVHQMMGFVFRLIPPRPSFPLDMSTDEPATMMAHVGYGSALIEQGRVLAPGPVDDPDGAYGIGIVVTESRSQAKKLRDDDPAVRSPHGVRTEIAPMLRLVTPRGVNAATPG
jgi:uncharacterized protein YciI